MTGASHLTTRRTHDAIHRYLSEHPRASALQVSRKVGCTVQYAGKIIRVRKIQAESGIRGRRLPEWLRILNEPRTDAEEELAEMFLALRREIIRDFRTFCPERGF